MYDFIHFLTGQNHPRLNMTMKYMKIVLELTLLTIFSPHKWRKISLQMLEVLVLTILIVSKVLVLIFLTMIAPEKSGESYHTHYITLFS